MTEKEQQSVSKVVKKPKALSTEFKTYHCPNLDQSEEQQKHEDKAEEVIERLEELVATTEPVIPHVLGMGDY